jgi:hypothetical protein
MEFYQFPLGTYLRVRRQQLFGRWIVTYSRTLNYRKGTAFLCPYFPISPSSAFLDLLQNST